MHKKKRTFDVWAFIQYVALIGAFCCVAFYTLSSYLTHKAQLNAIKSYEQSIVQSETMDLSHELEQAKQYNDIFYQTQGSILAKNAEILSTNSYHSLLNLNGNGIMGSIEIPKINVNLPIYHGTSDEVLENGVGHVQESSLPIGGLNTHAVLTGHRGLSSSKLFTRLDEMKQNDYFFIHMLGDTLAYQVKSIDVILPEEVDKLVIQPEKDLVSLITCTPYGINTHRLVVMGERVAYNEVEKESIKVALPSARETLFTILPFVFVMIVVLVKVREVLIKKRKHKECKKGEGHQHETNEH